MSLIALDCETTGLDFSLGDSPFMITACDDLGEIYIWKFPVDPVTRKVRYNRTQLQNFLKVIAKYDDWVFHHANFDLRALCVALNCSLEKLISYHKHSDSFWDHVHDTLIMFHVIHNDENHSLKYLAKKYVGIGDEDEDLLIKAVNDAKKVVRPLIKKGLLNWDIEGNNSQYYYLPEAVAKAFPDKAEGHWELICEDYGIRDVERTMSLYLVGKKILESRNLEGVYLNQIEVLRPVLRIEGRGMNFFQRKAKAELSKLQSSMDNIRTTLVDIASSFGAKDINFNSSDQMRDLLFDKMGFAPLKLTGAGKYSCDAEVLQTLLDEYEGPVDSPKYTFLSTMAELRKENTTANYISNYVRYAVPVTYPGKRVGHKLFPNLNSTGTKTTRFSSSNPNGQNISTGKEEEDEEGHKIKRFNLRELFGPPPGYVWYCIDYSSLQLIIFAYEANDAGMIDSFAKGYDFHNYVACGLFNTETPTKEQRRIAKNVNYALIFGAGMGRVDATAGMHGAYDLYCTQFPIVADYMEKTISRVRKKGYVETAFGYRLHVPSSQPYKGVNFIVQGDEGEIVKRAMILCDNYLDRHPSQAKLIFQIHDELVFECPANREFPVNTICNLMMSPSRNLGWTTPVTPAIATTHWGDQKKIELNLAT